MLHLLSVWALQFRCWQTRHLGFAIRNGSSQVRSIIRTTYASSIQNHHHSSKNGSWHMLWQLCSSALSDKPAKGCWPQCVWLVADLWLTSRFKSERYLGEAEMKRLQLKQMPIGNAKHSSLSDSDWVFSQSVCRFRQLQFEAEMCGIGTECLGARTEEYNPVTPDKTAPTKFFHGVRRTSTI